jgi:hypothetical protein
MLETIRTEPPAGSAVDPRIQEGADHAYRLAKVLLPACVEPPRRVHDPEADAEWWLAIVAKCPGDAASVLSAYNKLVERFVAEVPAEARDRIRFEIVVDA